MTFSLHADFDATSHFVADLQLCQARLNDDARFPWLILIPRVAAARDFDDLAAADQAVLTEEIARASAAVRALGLAQGRRVEKTNVAALGNVTPQLHVHVIGRRSDDAAWPRPVWGVGSAEAYGPAGLEAALATLRAGLG